MIMVIYESEERLTRIYNSMFIPVDDEKGWGQHIYVVDKDEKGDVTKKKLYGVSYVPLTDAPK
jgi:protein-L-isoaspartate(D-aspartate) O-methyltransferase